MASDRDILPDTVKPSNYNLSLYNLQFLGDWSYQGTVNIQLEIVKSAKEIVLNTNQLVIHSAVLSTEDGKTENALKASGITYNKDAQRATLTFDQEFGTAAKANLEIKFQGTINNLMAGFYRSRYKPAVAAAPSVPRDDEYHYMASTQFESCDARRAFPCFDEPNLKASLEFEIEIPSDQTALSNMPERETRKSNRDGWKVVAFEKSPVMSTYLFAWAFGDFEYVEDFTRRKYNGKSLPVRVYTTKGLKEQGEFALSVAHQIVDYFSEIFKIDYPLPKADLLAVHEFSHGAMENFGLVTYRTTAVLFDEKNSDGRYKKRVAYVVSHELAHQWFGNLVTMNWWNELWLNEGFATWVGWLAVDHLYPEWKSWSQFCSESLHNAFTLDSIRNSHPIDVPVRRAEEVDQVFDHISYLKGSSVIRMLAQHLGETTFLAGVSNYLKAHKWSNATTKNLWDALSEESKQDVNSFMAAWTGKIGFPVVNVTEEPGKISVKQSRFLVSGDVEAKDDETTWWIPLAIKSGDSAAASSDFKIMSQALTAKTDSIAISDSFYKLNANMTGFYRTSYPADRLKKLGQAAGRNQLTEEDRIGLVDDAAALAQSGDSSTAALLSLIEGFVDETEYNVWTRIIPALSHVKQIFVEYADITEALRKFTLKLVTPAVERVGWEFAPDEDYLTGQLRALLIAQAGRSGHEGVIAEARKRFADYISGSGGGHPSLRSPVFRVTVAAGGDAELEQVLAFYSATTLVDGREVALQAMGAVGTEERARKVLDHAFSDAVAVQDKHSAPSALSGNGKVRAVIWPYVKEHWEGKVLPQLSGNMVVLERFLKNALNKYASVEVERDIAAFFKDKDCKGFDRGLAVVQDTIVGAAKYKERDTENLREYLKANGYL